MNIMLNFIPLKSGGGVQVGLDFLEQLRIFGERHQWFLVATEGTPISQVQECKNLQVVKIVRNSIWSRFWFEYFGCRSLIRRIRTDLVYTQFGPHWPGAKSPNVVGCAYSNLFYPEVNFWGKHPLIKRGIRKMIDILRMYRLRRATHIIFETADLAERAVTVRGLSPKQISWVKPSVSSLVSETKSNHTNELKSFRLPVGFRVLLLSTYNPNKNIELLPKIAKCLNERHACRDVVFIITLPVGSRHEDRILNEAERLGVSGQVKNIGPVPHAKCAEVYEACDAVILPSQLESFSNTIAESWSMRKPLLISDMNWARSLCGEGAVYFRYDDPNDAATKLMALKNDSDFYRELVEAGIEELRAYSSASGRFLQYQEIMEKVTLRN